MSITRERLLKTLDLINEARERAIGRQGNIVFAFARHGIKATFYQATGVAVPAVENQRVELEANYLDAPRTRAEMEQVIEQWKAGIERFCSKTEKVFEIQERYGISGLVECVAELGGQSLAYPWCHEELRLIPPDLDIIRAEEARIVEFWCDRVKLAGLDIYLYKDSEIGWQNSNIRELMVYLPLSDWAHIGQERHYSSPSRRARDGFDQMRQQPRYSDDQLHCEYHLSLGVGVDIDRPASAWFCACNEVPLR